MAEFLMPRLGADMEAGTLVAWHKQPGEPVQRGDSIAEVETEKGVIDVEVFQTGVLDTIIVQPGQKVPVGTVLALIRTDDGAVTQAPPAAAPQAPAVPVPAPPPAPAVEPVRVRASGLARRMAADLGVDLAAVHGTGPGGAIEKVDVERAAATRGAVTAPSEADRRARMRQTIATAMARSKREVPHYYLATTIDVHRALTWLEEQNRARAIEDRLLPGALLLKAVARALHEVPELNAVWQDDRVVLSAAVHLGVAIALRHGGLVAPALRDADRLTLDELMPRFRDLVNRARAGSLRSSELSDPTITVTSLGEQGVEAVFGIIYPPQVAIVGFGKVVERAWVVDGQIVARRVVTATLSADHRVSDGHRGGLFLAAVDRLLQEPGQL